MATPRPPFGLSLALIVRLASAGQTTETRALAVAVQNA